MNALDPVEQLRLKYQARSATREAWQHEEPTLLAILATLKDDLAGRYEVGDALGVGGSGVVVTASDLHLGLERALKFSRPSVGKQTLLADLLHSETERLIDLSHPYVMRIHTKGSVEVEGMEFPYYVMDRHVGVDDSDEYVARPLIREPEFVKLLEKVLEGVVFIHSQGQVHLDIKPGNILVRPNGDPVIADLGFAKVLRDSGETLIGGTEGFMHPGARKWIVDASSDPNRLRGQAPRSEVSQLWDVYSLGKTILKLLDVVAARDDRPLSLYTHRYLRLMACRMLDGENDMTETLLGLTQRAFAELRYESSAQCLEDVRKLTGAYSLESQIPELNPYNQSTIQASTLATTPFTARVQAIVEHEEVQRLGGFTQLSLLNLVYPTATHTRLEHVVGVFSATVRYVTALYYDTINPLFRQIMRAEDLRAALLVALLHDIGHYALAHDLEEADHDTFSHEDRGKALLQDASTGLKDVIEATELSDGSAGWGASVERILSILSADVQKSSGTVRDRIIHSIIDGPIDADKLDYIIRDSANLGLTYGSVIDVERLLRCLTIISKQIGDDTYVNLGIHEKGRVTAEAVAFARYALYGSVYWHHAYRGVKAMLRRVAWEYLELVDKRNERTHEGLTKIVHKDFYPYLRVGGAPQALPLTSLTAGGQIHPGDRAILDWLGERSGDKGQELVEMLKDRHLFKRVLVLSRWGDNALWEATARCFDDRNWRHRLDFQRRFQLALAQAVEKLPSIGAAQTALIFADARNTFLADVANGSVVLLVDAAPNRPGASRGLELLEEDDRRRAKIDEVATTHPGVSTVWNALRDSLQDALGKVRIYCHPKHARFVSALDRSILEGALDRAARDGS